MTCAALPVCDASLSMETRDVMDMSAPRMCTAPGARPCPSAKGVLCGLQLPDRRHVARELRDIQEKSFAQLVGAYLERGSESISLPSNLLLMYMAVT